jgi:hypothetical protein
MRVAYLTTDEVNQELALQMAEKCGITLCLFEPRDDPPGNDYDAVLYDWDSWPAERRREALAQMLAGPLPHAVALHGHNLDDDQAEALFRHAVAVSRCLQPHVFRFLRLAVITVRAAKAVGRTRPDDSATGRRDSAARAPIRPLARQAALGPSAKVTGGRLSEWP